jgi:2-keto-3-deoxy-L-rhamnonate aldolase RhmA
MAHPGWDSLTIDLQHGVGDYRAADANDTVVVFAMIETLEGLENLEDILSNCSTSVLPMAAPRGTIPA